MEHVSVEKQLDAIRAAVDDNGLKIESHDERLTRIEQALRHEADAFGPEHVEAVSLPPLVASGTGTVSMPNES